jgi:hypothetical protein
MVFINILKIYLRQKMWSKPMKAVGSYFLTQLNYAHLSYKLYSPNILQTSYDHS